MIKSINAVLAIRAVTSRLPRIRGVGLALAMVANYFKKKTAFDIQVSVFGRKMLLNTGDAIGNVLIFTPQWYDFRERRLIKKIVAKGDYIIDIGANIGAYTLVFANLVGRSGMVTAIEAEENNANRLNYNVKANEFDWVTINNIGVSDKSELLSMLINNDGNAGAHSFFIKACDGEACFKSIQCKPLFDVVEKKKAKLMKLDIEGFEWRVLRQYFEDAPDYLWPEYIFLEDEPRHREDDAVALALRHGYILLRRFESNVFLVR